MNWTRMIASDSRQVSWSSNARIVPAATCAARTIRKRTCAIDSRTALLLWTSLRKARRATRIRICGCSAAIDSRDSSADLQVCREALVRRDRLGRRAHAHFDRLEQLHGQRRAAADADFRSFLRHHISRTAAAADSGANRRAFAAAQEAADDRANPRGNADLHRVFLHLALRFARD